MILIQRIKSYKFRPIYFLIIISIHKFGYNMNYITCKNIFTIFIMLASKIFAIGIYTKIHNSTLYSEYYPNNNSVFKGTIIFENGSGMALTQWTKNKKFFSCARNLGSLFFYDRNGLGKSQPDLTTSITNPITADMENKKLFQLLKKNNLPPPYIIIGHSYGGMYADYFARKYIHLIHGVLLVDPTPQNLEYSDSFQKFQNSLDKWKNIPSYLLYKENSYKNAIASNYKIIPAEVFYETKGINNTRQQINQLPKLPNNIPIIILSSTKMAKDNVMKYGWLDGQKEYLNKNINSRILVTDTSHQIWENKPLFVCDQIKL